MWQSKVAGVTSGGHSDCSPLSATAGAGLTVVFFCAEKRSTSIFIMQSNVSTVISGGHGSLTFAESSEVGRFLPAIAALSR